MKKMFVKRINLPNLRNDLHFEFIGSMLDVLNRFEVPHIGELLPKLAALRDHEDEAIDRVRKSDITGQIQESDHQRDNAFRGMKEAVRTALRHSDPAKHGAASRLNIVFDTFKKVPKLDMHAESSAIHNLLQELELRRTDVDLLELGEWMDTLRSSNDNVRALTAQRNSEVAARTQFRMKEVKTEVNAAYNEILLKLEAVALLEGEEKYAPLFNEMNARVDEYLRIVAHSKNSGKNKSGNPQPATGN